MTGHFRGGHSGTNLVMDCAGSWECWLLQAWISTMSVSAHRRKSACIADLLFAGLALILPLHHGAHRQELLISTLVHLFEPPATYLHTKHFFYSVTFVASGVHVVAMQKELNALTKHYSSNLSLSLCNL